MICLCVSMFGSACQDNFLFKPPLLKASSCRVPLPILDMADVEKVLYTSLEVLIAVGCCLGTCWWSGRCGHAVPWVRPHSVSLCPWQWLIFWWEQWPCLLQWWLMDAWRLVFTAASSSAVWSLCWPRPPFTPCWPSLWTDTCVFITLSGLNI